MHHELAQRGQQRTFSVTSGGVFLVDVAHVAEHHVDYRYWRYWMISYCFSSCKLMEGYIHDEHRTA